MNCLRFNVNTFGIPMCAQLTVTYNLWEGPEDDWITVETCSPIVVSENKCCADVKTDLFIQTQFPMSSTVILLKYAFFWWGFKVSFTVYAKFYVSNLVLKIWTFHLRVLPLRAILFENLNGTSSFLYNFRLRLCHLTIHVETLLQLKAWHRQVSRKFKMQIKTLSYWRIINFSLRLTPTCR